MQHDTRCMILNSVNRIPTTTPDNCTIQFMQPITGRWRLKQVIFTNYAYPVNNSNNIVYFYENGTNKQFSLPLGNYTTSTLITALINGLNTASGGFNTYTSSFNGSTQILTVTATSVFAFQWGNVGSSASQLLGWQIVNTSLATSQTGSSPVDLVQPLAFLWTFLDGTTTCSIEDSSQQIYGTFLTPLYNAFGSLESYEPLEPNNIYLTFNNQPRLFKVKITDLFGNSINNNMNWVIVIEKCD